MLESGSTILEHVTPIKVSSRLLPPAYTYRNEVQKTLTLADLVEGIIEQPPTDFERIMGDNVKRPIVQTLS